MALTTFIVLMIIVILTQFSCLVNTRAVNETDDSVTVEDLFGNLVKVEKNRVAVVGSSARDLGMFALKAMLLGPLIGVTLKGALIRGLIWAMITYGLHLVWPALLLKLGLGSGLVGFARQLQPEYAQLLMPHLVNLPATIQQLLPKSVTQMTNQYIRAFSPLLDSISTIPDEACRHRAVCEAADHLIRNSPYMSNSLQRVSATVYVNFGSEYSKAWLDGIVQSDCGAKYAQCVTSPFSNMASKLAESLGNAANLRELTQAGASVSTTIATTIAEAVTASSTR